MSTTRIAARRAIIAYNTVIGPAAALGAIVAGSPLLALPLILGGHVPWMIATLTPHCGWFGPVITTLGDDVGRVWLTIDDGPDPDDTPLLLDLLDEFGEKATFFFIGEKASQHPELVREVVKRGHHVGNHTMTHPHFRFWAYGPAAARREINACRAVLESLTGGTVRQFRAPAGLKNPFVQHVLDREGISLIGWTARGLDGVRTDRSAILERIRSGIAPGAIVLVHEGRADEEGRRLAPDVLRGTLEYIRERGLRTDFPRMTQ